MLERTLSVMTADARREARLKEAVPLLQDFWSFVEENAPHVLPRTMLGNAFQYAINNRSRPATFLKMAGSLLPMSGPKMPFRPFAVGRKNWLFAGLPQGPLQGYRQESFAHLSYLVMSGTCPRGRVPERGATLCPLFLPHFFFHRLQMLHVHV